MGMFIWQCFLAWLLAKAFLSRIFIAGEFRKKLIADT